MNTPNHPRSVSANLKPQISWRRCLPMLIAIIGIFSAIFALSILGVYYRFKGQQTTKPVVLIRTPSYGERFEVDQVTTMHAIARDDSNIIRLELWVNGQLVETETSNLTGGLSPFPMLATWQPTFPGNHTLTIRFIGLGFKLLLLKFLCSMSEKISRTVARFRSWRSGDTFSRISAWMEKRS